MKKLFSITVISCLVAFSGLFSSCKQQEESEWLYYIQLDSSTDNMNTQDLFFSIIEPSMLNVMKNDADRYTEYCQMLYFNGGESAALNRAKKSFRKAYKALENSPEGAINVSGKGIKVNLCRYHGGDYRGDVMDSHTF
jgi:phosphomevalonate kinase